MSEDIASTAQLRQIIREEIAELASQGQSRPTSGAASGAKVSSAELRQIVHEEVQQAQSPSDGSSTHKSSNQLSPSKGSKSPAQTSRPSSKLTKLIRQQLGGNSSTEPSAPESSSAKKGQVRSKSGGSQSEGSQSQTVAQVLTQAQYELSQELEANLKKLRSVIQESQEIAKKIEMVLGKGSGSQGSSQ